ncbi:DUF6415 family natural product biosynthesis protein [Streptomyces sp. bgisy029]|uniref:DUF6415 family natural product biosynthesis protein n=1 Tax=Streptomyces sp. bgisy029 TaxID=3413771 RepID=UPI003D75FE40
MSAAQQARTAADMVRDSDLALSLISLRNITTAEAGEVRERLCGHVNALLVPASTFADSLADSRAKDIAQATVEHARRVAEDQEGDPEATLRLLAKSVTLLLRYTSDEKRRQAT